MMTTENDMQNDLNPTKPLSESENTQLNPELIDDCFYVERKSFGAWVSHDKEGKNLVTSYTKDQCIEATQFYLKHRQDNGNY